MPKLPAAPAQGILDLGVEVQRDVNGVEMGVLENGIPFLTQRGLAKIAGVHRSVISDLSQEWEATYDDDVIGKDRISFLREKLRQAGYNERKLYIEIRKDGSLTFAYPDIVCMAIIEYYAFEAKTPSSEAIDNFRRLATFGLQKFIYEALKYTPADRWMHYHDRVSLLRNSAPDGYWIVFNAITGLIVDLINANLTVNDRTIPDISVGIAWSAHWDTKGLNKVHGERVKCEHNYPSYFRQAPSNPQHPWAYPDAALPEFKRWFRHEYLMTKFPLYILKKANVLPGGVEEAKAIGRMYEPKRLTR